MAQAPVPSQAPPARTQVVHAFDKGAPPVPSTTAARPPSPAAPDPPFAIPAAEASGPRPPPAPPIGSPPSVGPPPSTPDESTITGVPPVPMEFDPPPLPISFRSVVFPPPAFALEGSTGIAKPEDPPAPPLTLRPDRSTRQPANANTARNPPREGPWSACLIVYYSRRDSVRCQSLLLRGPRRWLCFR
jgi:type VI secretion system secreted protein VgrG